jgi:hypothetical protein
MVQMRQTTITRLRQSPSPLAQMRQKPMIPSLAQM